jgi:Glycosyl hydrolases family 39
MPNGKQEDSLKRLRWLCLSAALLVVCAAPAAAHAVSYGADVDGDFDYYATGFWTWDQVEASLRSLHAAGGTVARAAAHWETAEAKRPLRGRPQYNWRYDDMIARALANARIHWDPTLDYTPNWAEVKVQPLVYRAKGARLGFVAPEPPANYAVYGAYVAAFARRYGVGGSFWRAHPRLPAEPVKTFEIWNEPDDRWTWGRNVNLQDYAKLYTVAYRAIKSVDRQSQVITGGLAFNYSSLIRLLKAFEGLPMDGLGVHAYAVNPNATIAIVRWTETQMTEFGRGRTPLIVNEFGWNNSPRKLKLFQSVPARDLNSYLVRSIVGLSKIKQVSSVIPFDWADPSWGLSDGAFARGVKLARAR